MLPGSRTKQIKKECSMSLKYCDDHCCYYNPSGKCDKCEAGLPGHIRQRSEVNPTDIKRIADLEKRGLIEKKIKYCHETKENREIRLANRDMVLKELDKRHKQVMKFIKNNDWDGLKLFEADIKPLMGLA